MKIKEIFTKDINRNIRGVIKIGQETDAIKKQELEEYVVTKELQTHFKKFFKAYVDSINQTTDATGVWISGFFGSGKSHFLKILSYLLENKKVAGKSPIDYFYDTDKINDEETFQLIKETEKISNDVILFNIDAKADANSRTEKSAILTVFLRVFNEKLGYDSNPEVANLERWLDEHDYYEKFQNVFYEIIGREWKEVRNSFSFIKNSVKKALVKSGAMDELNASDYLSNMGKYQINPEEFAEMVSKYLTKKGSNSHIVFLADEVGQFIGDNPDRMLNLQTIVEQLQIQCQGRAWVVVTSQQQLNEVTMSFNKQKREDLSKIQGRFNTMINMSSANADEVIQKRLLEKKIIAKEELVNLFEEKSYNINNKINFSDQINRKNYRNTRDFVDNYPFIPYQFDLLKDVLSAVRKHGAEGKHMSDGERSMLATFQTAVQKFENNDIGTLIPFSAFFEGMYEFLSHDHQVVFVKALADEKVCPNGNHDSFIMQVLYVLFMIKYLDNFPATIENITTLLLNNISSDREALIDKVKLALNVLLEQKYIQKNIDTYEFLTDKEQDVNEIISNYDVDDAYIIKKIGDDLIGDKYINNRFIPKNMGKQYIFDFNVCIDDSVYGRLNNSQSLCIVTPMNPSDPTQYTLSAQSGDKVILVLPDNIAYIAAFRRIGQIEQYLQKSVGNRNNYNDSIRIAKVEERNALEKSASDALHNDLNSAVIYVMNDVMDDNTDIKIRLNNAYKKVIDTSYRYLSYLTSIESEKDIIHLFKNGHNNSELINDNQQAEKEVIYYLESKISTKIQALSMTEIRNHFSKIPYGYNDEDIAWLVAKAFVDGKISLLYNNELISLDDAVNNSERIASYLIKKQSAGKLTLEVVREIPEKQKKAASDYVKEILHKKSILSESNSTKQLAMKIAEETNLKVEELKGYDSFKGGPDQLLLEKGINLLEPIAHSKNDSNRTFSLIFNNLNKLENWLKEMDDNGVVDFYNSDVQQVVWKHSQRYIERYRQAREFINEKNKVHDIEKEIEDQLNKENIGSVIPMLKVLNQNFADEFNNLIDQLYSKYEVKSKKSLNLLLQRLADANLPENEEKMLKQAIKGKFELREQAAKKSSNEGNYTDLNSQILLLDSDFDSLQQKLDQTSQQIAQQDKNQIFLADPKIQSVNLNEHDQQNKNTFSAKVKRTKSMKICDLEKESWRIANQKELNIQIDKLRDKLQKELDNYDIINVDFK